SNSLFSRRNSLFLQKIPCSVDREFHGKPLDLLPSSASNSLGNVEFCKIPCARKTANALQNEGDLEGHKLWHAVADAVNRPPDRPQPRLSQSLAAPADSIRRSLVATVQASYPAIRRKAPAVPSENSILSRFAS